MTNGCGPEHGHGSKSDTAKPRSKAEVEKAATVSEPTPTRPVERVEAAPEKKTVSEQGR